MLIICLINTGLSACVSHHYIQLTENIRISGAGAGFENAKATFSSLMPGAPTLVLEVNQEFYLIKNELVEKRSPIAATKNFTYLPVGKIITFRYNNMEIVRSTYVPIIQGGPLGTVIQLKEQKYIETCSDVVRFMPVVDKQYEVSFGAVNGSCEITIMEIVRILEGGRKVMKDAALASGSA